MRVLRVYHGGRIRAHRARDRAIAAAGHEVVLVVPSTWTEGGSEAELSHESFEVVELPVTRAGDINRHRYADDDAVRRVLERVRPDVLDLHEEPVSLVARQWLRNAPPDLPVAMYTAQNLDKRFPPPFAQWEKRALRRVQAVYPCSRQAASVVRGKGFAGHLEVLPLGYDPDLFFPGDQSLDDEVLRLGLVGRMVPEKGVLDAVHVLAAAADHRPARLLLIGDGPEVPRARALAAELGVSDRLEHVPWLSTPDLAALYRTLHVVLVPSVATSRWIEQFGRMIVEGQASGAAVAGYWSGSIPEVTADAGLLAAEGDLQGLTRVVHRLLSSPGDWRRLRSAGIELALDRTWATVGRAHADLLDRAVSERPMNAVGRAAARAEFGAPASSPFGQTRPHALPVLRGIAALGR
ncbi:glycosyltransferase family 4 protein [Nocardioides litoris]|uniref:glycosyltransferase family 4 protein n=1 Tax=Nocardioides litoris TaxID=1926648 RepID=UPI00111FCC5C|nr:glycosyltransferase [Nocardioides litoris]